MDGRLQIDTARRMLSAIIDGLSGTGTKSAIGAFQDHVWHHEVLTPDAEVDEILRDLAYDLDYYEPDPNRRREDWSFYGDEKLINLIRQAIEMIEGLESHDRGVST